MNKEALYDIVYDKLKKSYSYIILILISLFIKSVHIIYDAKL